MTALIGEPEDLDMAALAESAFAAIWDLPADDVWDEVLTELEDGGASGEV